MFIFQAGTATADMQFIVPIATRMTSYTRTTTSIAQECPIRMADAMQAVVLASSLDVPMELQIAIVAARAPIHGQGRDATTA